MDYKQVRVTPEMAKQWLETNPRNRTLDRKKIDQMVKDIKTGHFDLTHQGIALAPNGMLLDGQHRLVAICEAGMAVDLMVAYDSRNSTKIDIGRPRDAKTSLYMSGVIEKNSSEYCRLTYPLIRTIVLENFGSAAVNTLSADDLHNIYSHHSQDIDTIIGIIDKGSKTGVPTRSSILAYAMLCAYHAGCPVTVLAKWHEILRTGDYLDVDDTNASKAGKSVVIFINYSRGKRIDIKSSEVRREEFIKKAMSSIRYYEKKQCVTKIYGERCYPPYEMKPEDFFPLE